MLHQIKQYVQLSPAAEQALREVIMEEAGKKGDLLLREGMVCRKIWFLTEGFARVYYRLGDREVTDWIEMKNGFVLSIPSFFNQSASHKSIELITDCRLNSITHQDLELLFKQFHEIERFGRLISNYALTMMSQKVEDLVFKTAHQRYRKLMDERPEILLNVPLNFVASLLGMSQETLSRMRAI
ncbi:MAG: Crp/Fnr family transcriptional regulator [Saprospiraceae bacterium]|nr:Crp/Fnr family transcriptional regulator [Saprospiraceae bacterium]